MEVGARTAAVPHARLYTAANPRMKLAHCVRVDRASTIGGGLLSTMVSRAQNSFARRTLHRRKVDDQLMQIVGERNVRIVPDVAVNGANGTSGLVDGLLGVMLKQQSTKGSKP